MKRIIDRLDFTNARTAVSSDLFGDKGSVKDEISKKLVGGLKGFTDRFAPSK